MAQALRAWAINQREKTRSVTYSTDRENEVSKRYVFVAQVGDVHDQVLQIVNTGDNTKST